MNADLLYAILMGAGWVFLVGWLALLVVACGLAFRSDTRMQPTIRRARLASGAYESQVSVTRKTPWKVHLRN